MPSKLKNPKNKLLLKRNFSTKPYKKAFHILYEGSVTEKQYFEWLGRVMQVNIKPVKSKSNSRTACHGLLNLMIGYQKNSQKNNIRKGDEVWIVIDQDNRQERDKKFEQFPNSCKSNNCSLAISHPQFEYWLLLHFEEGVGVSNGNACCDRLEKHYRNKSKSKIFGSIKEVPCQFYNVSMVKDAIKHAERRVKDKDSMDPFYSDVYILVKNIMESEQNQS